jgi:predicted GH43/DUF377 family glycosyl hydrolase
MNWNKLGRIFKPSGDIEWMQSHTMLPVAKRIKGDRYRVYFASRNTDNMSQIGYVVIDITDPTTILEVSDEPVLGLGDLGTFDDSGVFPSAIVDSGNKTYLYYVGWMQGKRIPFHGMIGLAVSDDGGETFEKYSKAPLVTRSEVDPYMTLSMDVHETEDKWKMWYTSTTECVVNEEGNTIPNYHIKYAESDDGIDWQRNGTVCMDYADEKETRIARPRVIHRGDTYRMWYCYAHGEQGYRIGYAESSDGKDWERMDDSVGITVSATGWDSQMMAYPYIVEHVDDLYMFYNGNEYGETGFGIAVLEEEK